MGGNIAGAFGRDFADATTSLIDTLCGSLESKSALIVKMGAIGDVIMTLPAVRLLYERGFEIHWVCGRDLQPLLECYPWMVLIPVNERAILKGTPFEQGRAITGLWSRLALRKWDVCATLYNDFRYRILTLPVRARHKIALSKRSRCTTVLMGRSYADEFARILLGTADGCRPQSIEPLKPGRLPPSPLPVKIAERRVAIVPGGATNLHSQQTLRRWPVESYVSLAMALRKRNWEVVLLGGSDDAWVRPFFDLNEVNDWIGTLSIPEVISVCNTCDAVVSHDTGPLHLAGVSNASLVGIFGPTNPGSFLPRRPGVVGIWGGEHYACRPCYDGRSFAACASAGCMREVSPDLVMHHLLRLIDAKSRGISEPWKVIFAPTAKCASNAARI
jgi:heptosyltransferase-2